jgi:Fe-S cluster biogenesis protein NfuA
MHSKENTILDDSESEEKVIQIFTEPTPNPLAMKFWAEVSMALQGEYIFSSPMEAQDLPALEEILSLPGIQSVFICPQFLTVTKKSVVSWDLLENIIISILQHHSLDFPLDCQQAKTESPTVAFAEIPRPQTEEEKSLYQEIEDVLDGHIRPAIAEDGGFLSFLGFQNGVVYIQLRGACEGCPSSEVTLKDGIERTLKYYIPEVESVESVL